MLFHSPADTHIAHFVSNDEKMPMIITVRRAVDDDERLIRIHAVISTPEVRENMNIIYYRLLIFTRELFCLY